METILMGVIFGAGISGVVCKLSQNDETVGRDIDPRFDSSSFKVLELLYYHQFIQINISFFISNFHCNPGALGTSPADRDDTQCPVRKELPRDCVI
jgi:hypothetical protein